MKSSGCWNEAGEDIYEVDIEVQVQHCHGFGSKGEVVQIVFTILKLTAAVEPTHSSRQPSGPTLLHVAHNPFLTGANVLIDDESSYFNLSEQRLSSQHVRRHSVALRRQSQTFGVDNLNEIINNGMMKIGNGACRSSMISGPRAVPLRSQRDDNETFGT
jgi:hypothetical protein